MENKMIGKFVYDLNWINNTVSWLLMEYKNKAK